MILRLISLFYFFYFGIKVENWWSQNIHNNWFVRFIVENNLRPREAITIYSVFGSRQCKKPSIFFCGENLKKFYENKYSEMENSSLSLTFEPTRANNIYFPLWIIYFFGPKLSRKNIYDKFYEWNNLKYERRHKFAALVARHDIDGYRRIVFEKLSHIGHVSCGGALLNNDSQLQKYFNNNKKEYLKQFRYNICPENTDDVGYITEKIFEAIDAGCIPIYRGSRSNIGGIFNESRIIFSDDKDFVEKVSWLEANEQEYIRFYNQSPFTKSAPDFVYDKLIILKSEIERIFCDSSLP